MSATMSETNKLCVVIRACSQSIPTPVIHIREFEPSVSVGQLFDLVRIEFEYHVVLSIEIHKLENL